MNQIIDERRMNWLWIDNEVVDRFGPQIGAYGLAVYAVLARFADNRTRVAFPAASTIAVLLKLSRNTVLTAIKSLESTEPPLLTVTTFGGGRNANTYTLNDLAPHKQLPSPTPSKAMSTPTNDNQPPPDLPRSAPQAVVARQMNSSYAPDEQHLRATRAGAARHMNSSYAPDEQHLRATRAGAARHMNSSYAPHAQELYSYNYTHGTIPIEQDDDDARAREHARANDDNALSSSSSSSPSSPSLESSSFQPPVLETWEDLEGEYGVELVRQAVEAAPDDKRNSLKYVAGILKNWRREGADQRRNRRKRSDPFAHDAGQAGGAEEVCAPDGADLPAADPPPPPAPSSAWQVVVEQIALGVPKSAAFSLRNSTSDARLENSTLIVEATDKQIATWLENRLGRAIKETWNRCHPGLPVTQVVVTKCDDAN
jgi:DnaD/phage-associated family protein